MTDDADFKRASEVARAHINTSSVFKGRNEYYSQGLKDCSWVRFRDSIVETLRTRRRTRMNEPKIGK